MKRFALLLIAALILPMLPVSGVDASPNETEIPLTWHAEYFDNQYLIGPPEVVREEGALNHEWGYGAPLGQLPSNYFTVRWATRTSLDAGTYRFSVTADDSVKVTIDYTNIVINSINNPQPGETLTADFDLVEGSHYFQVDYRELTGAAYIQATLERLDSQSESELENTPTAVVDVYALRVRRGPGLDYEEITQEQRGTIVKLIGRNADATWANVILPSGVQGWMSTAYLEPNVELATLPILTTEITDGGGTVISTDGQEIGIVTAMTLTVREAPNVSSDVLGYVTRFTPLRILGRNFEGTWLLILHENGTVGWVSRAFVMADGNIFELPVMSTEF